MSRFLVQSLSKKNRIRCQEFYPFVACCWRQTDAHGFLPVVSIEIDFYQSPYVLGWKSLSDRCASKKENQFSIKSSHKSEEKWPF